MRELAVILMLFVVWVLLRARRNPALAITLLFSVTVALLFWIVLSE